MLGVPHCSLINSFPLYPSVTSIIIELNDLFIRKVYYTVNAFLSDEDIVIIIMTYIFYITYTMKTCLKSFLNLYIGINVKFCILLYL